MDKWIKGKIGSDQSATEANGKEVGAEERAIVVARGLRSTEKVSARLPWPEAARTPIVRP